MEEEAVDRLETAELWRPGRSKTEWVQTSQVSLLKDGEQLRIWQDDPLPGAAPSWSIKPMKKRPVVNLI